MGRRSRRHRRQLPPSFAEADATLGEPLSRSPGTGPSDELDLTVNAQPALLASVDRVPARGGGAARGGWSAAASRPVFAGRPLDGPVQRARGGRRPVAGRWAAPGARARDVSCRPPAGRPGAMAAIDRPPRRAPARARGGRRGARHLRRRQPQLARPGRGQSGVRPRRGGRGRAARGSAPSARSCCRSAWPPTRRSMAQRGGGNADGPRRRRVRRSPRPLARERRRPAADHAARPAGPSWSTTSRPASTGSPPSTRCAARASRTFVEVGPGAS